MKRFVVALAVTLTCASASAESPADTVRIGVIGPFTGGSADFGIPMLNGVKLAVDEINSVGGYLGRKLELVIKDDRADPAAGRAAAEAMRSEHVVAAIAFCNTGVAMKSIDVFQTAKIPLIVPCATGTPITTTYPAKDSYIFRTSARDEIQAPFVVKDIVRRGWKRVAVLADRSGYGEAGLKDVKGALEKQGLTPAYVGRFDVGVKDLTAEMKEARAAAANVVFTYTVGPENAVVARAREQIKWKVPIVGPWTLSFPFFIDGAGSLAEGALMVQTFIAEPSNERRTSFLSSYSKTYKTPRIPVPMAAAQAYDSIYILTYALLGIRGGDFSGPAVKEALENIRRTYYGVVATYEKPFSAADKDAIDESMLVLGEVKKGQVTFAYPESARKNLLVQRKKAS
ncbi:ABC transporter substrate-binding protein [Ramlibacter humi]|nr:ABC transporter substrate-binding protein [Ramlibacter humi]